MTYTAVPIPFGAGTEVADVHQRVDEIADDAAEQGGRQQPQGRWSLQAGEDERGHHEQQDARRRLREAEQDRGGDRRVVLASTGWTSITQLRIQPPSPTMSASPTTPSAIPLRRRPSTMPIAPMIQIVPIEREQRREDGFVGGRVRRRQIGDEIAGTDEADEDNETAFEPLGARDVDHRDDQLHHRDDVQDIPESRTEHDRCAAEGDPERGEVPARSRPQGCHACGTFQHGAWRRDNEECECCWYRLRRAGPLSEARSSSRLRARSQLLPRFRSI